MSTHVLETREQLEQLSPAQVAAEQVLNQRRLIAGLTQGAKATAWSVAAIGLDIVKGAEQISYSGYLDYHPYALALGIAAVAVTAKAVYAWAREVPRAFNGANQIITPNETTG